MRNWANRAVWLRMVCALALLLFGLGGPAFGDSGPTGNAAYRLPDGSFASLCEPGSGSQDGRSGVPGKACRHCDLCRAGLPHALPLPSMAFVSVRRLAAYILPLSPDAGVVHTGRSFAWQSRGPPAQI
jgi:hypothetical protein